MRGLQYLRLSLDLENSMIEVRCEMEDKKRRSELRSLKKYTTTAAAAAAAAAKATASAAEAEAAEAASSTAAVAVDTPTEGLSGLKRRIGNLDAKSALAATRSGGNGLGQSLSAGALAATGSGGSELGGAPTGRYYGAPPLAASFSAGATSVSGGAGSTFLFSQPADATSASKPPSKGAAAVSLPAAVYTVPRYEAGAQAASEAGAQAASAAWPSSTPSSGGADAISSDSYPFSGGNGGGSSAWFGGSGGGSTASYPVSGGSAYKGAGAPKPS